MFFFAVVYYEEFYVDETIQEDERRSKYFCNFNKSLINQSVNQSVDWVLLQHRTIDSSLYASAPEMAYIVSGGTLNSIHSLTPFMRLWNGRPRQVKRRIACRNLVVGESSDKQSNDLA